MSYEVPHEQLATYTTRVIVAGSRTYTNYKEFVITMDEYSKKLPSNTAFISGNASRGADAMLIHWAELRRKPYALFAADWEKHKRIAGFIRNLEMAKVATHLFLIYDGKSNGSRNMLYQAKKRDLKTTVFLFNPQEQPEERNYPHGSQKDLNRPASTTGFTFRMHDSD